MKRRTVHFATLDEALEDARGLLKSGYDRAGNWSLGQACNHMATSFEMTLSGFAARVPVFMQQAFIGAFIQLSSLGRIGDALGMRLPTIAPQKTPVDDESGLKRLASAVQTLEDSGAAHLTRFHLWHLEHHLSFLIPRDSGTSKGKTA